MSFFSEAVKHVEHNLDANLSLHALAARSEVSPWHFHRRFRAQTGEAPAGYVRRLRLELAAVLLKHSELPVTEIAFRTGYAAHEAFTRAFRARFGIAPLAFRKRWPAGHGTGEGRIVSLPARRMAFVRRVGPYAQVAKAFEELLTWANRRRLEPDAVLGIYLDDQDVTEPERTRYEAALCVSADVQPDAAVAIRALPAADWAVFRHSGSVAERRKLYGHAYRSWIPAAGRRAAPLSPIERHAYSGRRVEYGAVEVHIPIEPR